MNPPTTRPVPLPNADPSLAAPLPTDQASVAIQRSRVGGPPLLGGHNALGDHASTATGDPFSTTTMGRWGPLPAWSSSSSPADHHADEPQTDGVGGIIGPPVPPIEQASANAASAAGWLELRIWAEMHHDAEDARTRAENRVRSATVDAAIYEAHIEQLKAVEQACELALKRTFRRVAPPELVAWRKAEKGLGEKTVARLLGFLGDPFIATPHQWTTAPPVDHECDPNRCGSGRHLVALPAFQRTISQLWAYCGHGDPARKKTKGMTADDAFELGSPECKKRLWVIASRAIVEPGRDIQALLAGEQELGAQRRYRHVYELRRLETIARVHASPCVRCGPAGRPAAEGSPWSEAHRNADALRVVGKELLRDMWRLRHAASQGTIDTQTHLAGGELEREAS